MRLRFLLVVAIVALSGAAFAQHRDVTHDQPAVANAVVDFGQFASTPLGPLPCLQTGGIAGATDPCTYKLHRLIPEEVTIFKDGQVTFQVHGGGHAMAIYEVSKDTSREELGQFLCAGVDPDSITLPTLHRCNLTTPAGIANASAAHVITDGKGDVVIVASPNITNAHPDNRVWYEENRLMFVGGNQFLNGGTTAVNGELITYRFLKTGRYLVICANRSHLLNDWMFGFVNVTGQ